MHHCIFVHIKDGFQQNKNVYIFDFTKQVCSLVKLVFINGSCEEAGIFACVLFVCIK